MRSLSQTMIMTLTPIVVSVSVSYFRHPDQTYSLVLQPFYVSSLSSFLILQLDQGALLQLNNFVKFTVKDNSKILSTVHITDINPNIQYFVIVLSCARVCLDQG